MLIQFCLPKECVENQEEDRFAESTGRGNLWAAGATTGGTVTIDQ